MKLTPAFSQVDLNFWLAVMNAWYSGGGVDAPEIDILNAREGGDQRFQRCLCLPRWPMR